jgi:hypothetical protein
MLFQQLVNRMCSHCSTRLLSSTDLLQVVSLINNLLSSCNLTICHQVVSSWQPCSKHDEILLTGLLQLVDKLATSLLQTHLANKLWDLYSLYNQDMLKIFTNLSMYQIFIGQKNFFFHRYVLLSIQFWLSMHWVISQFQCKYIPVVHCLLEDEILTTGWISSLGLMVVGRMVTSSENSLELK